jgi:hypothetical protein
MNERIRELMVKASSGACYDGNIPTLYGHDPINEIEEFAKLIVRECATICDTIGNEARKEWKTKYIPHDDGRCDGAWQCETAILEHFGVE